MKVSSDSSERFCPHKKACIADNLTLWLLWFIIIIIIIIIIIVFGVFI